MTQLDRVAELVSTAGGTESLLAWLSNDMTMLMMGAARELARPVNPVSADAGALGLALGETLGAIKIIEYLTSPIQSAQEQQPVPSYGSSAIMKENGYATDE